jgi:hypothetical protein
VIMKLESLNIPRDGSCSALVLANNWPIKLHVKVIICRFLDKRQEDRSF